jgi:hypothetical protein
MPGELFLRELGKRGIVVRETISRDAT